MSCTAVNHGFNDTIVLKIFEALLGHTCLKKNHAYTATGPAVHNLTRGTTYCTRWKNIPEKMNCNRSPVYKRRFRLCPCVESKYLLSFNSINSSGNSSGSSSSIVVEFSRSSRTHPNWVTQAREIDFCEGCKLAAPLGFF